MAAKKLSARNQRRAHARTLEKLGDARTRLAAIEEGGSPQRPLEIASASLVEVTARSARCTRCDGALRLEEHVVVPHDAQLLREARLVCAACGAHRSMWFRIVTTLPS